MNQLFINSLRILTMAIFLALVPILFYYDFGTSLVWTILIPLLPVALLIIGFSRWRDICPLAMISKISQKMNFIQKRKVPKWFENNFWAFQYGFLFIALCLRLTTLNYHNDLLGTFFILVVLGAFFINLFYTGKSWCNFFCPVGAVEKIYTISNSKNYMLDSACSTCTACKKNCPDIDLESNYWKEGALKQKSFVFYSFPGMILGFYLYFYLQSGSLSYYFIGKWTQEDFSLLSSGFFFAQQIPVFIAVPLSLSIFTLISYYFFKAIENYLWGKRVFKDASFETTSHKIKTISSFVAFNIFYIFAGAPAYQHFPLIYAIFYFAVVSISSTILYKEFFREEAYFIQERFALKIIKRWDSSKVIPSSLKEIYYTYVNDSKNKKERLSTYRESIIDLMQEGILTEGSFKILDKLRKQIGITNTEHDSILRLIKLKNEHLFDSSTDHSAETLHQEKSYKQVVENALSEHIELDAKYLKNLQNEFNISDDVHKNIMHSILNSNVKITEDIISLLKNIENLIDLENSIYEDATREIFFLKYSIKNEFVFHSKALFTLLFTIYKDNTKVLKVILNMSKGKHVPENFVFNEETISFMEPEISEMMITIYKKFKKEQLHADQNDNTNLIKKLLNHDSLQISTAALLNTKHNPTEFLNDNILEKFSNTDDIEIQSLLYKLKNNTNRITTYERMVYLNYIPIFKNLKFDNLHKLGQSSKVMKFKKNEYIITQGNLGSTLFVLVKGAAVVEIDGQNVAEVGHRDYFGEIALLGDTKRTASVKVTEDTVALRITKKQFKKFLQNNPKVSTQVMKEIIKKLI